MNRTPLSLICAMMRPVRLPMMVDDKSNKVKHEMFSVYRKAVNRDRSAIRMIG